MKIAIFTQEVPFYIPELLKKLLNKNRKEFDFELYCFKSYNKSIAREIIKRFEYYGIKEFSKFIIKTMIKKIGRLSSIKEVCTSLNISYNYIKTNKIDKDFKKHLKKSKLELILSIGCPFKLDSELLELPEIGCLNYHTAKLPRNRGRQPLFWAMLNEEKESAVTIHWIDEKIDNGPILCQKTFNIGDLQSLDAAYKRSLSFGLEALNEALILLKEGNYLRLPNDETNATYNHFPDKEAGKLFRKKGFTFF